MVHADVVLFEPDAWKLVKFILFTQAIRRTNFDACGTSLCASSGSSRRSISRGKIIDAARHLGLTAPAVTLQLQHVEEAVGVDLFERASSGLRPTDAGRAFIKAARAVDECLRALSDEIDAIKGVRKGGLVVGAVSTAKYFAPRIIAAFKQAFPDIELKLLVGNRARSSPSLEYAGLTSP